MTYFPDLSPYRYGFEPASWSAAGPPGVEPEVLYWWPGNGLGGGAFSVPEVNVGWLDPGHDFPRGDLPAELVEKLDGICRASRFNMTRGWHCCRFCSGSGAHGSAEIRIMGDGVVYAAPTLIAHYVAAHRYLPPEGFVRALRDCPGQAEADPSLLRPVAAEMVERAPVPLDALEAAIREEIESGYRAATFPEIALRDAGEQVVVFARIVPRPGGASVARTWMIPRAALLNPEQAAFGIESMLNRMHMELGRDDEE